MTVQTFIPNGAQAASENTVTQPQHTPAIDRSVKKLYIETQGCQMNEYDSHRMADLLGDSHGYVLTPRSERSRYSTDEYLLDS